MIKAFLFTLYILVSFADNAKAQTLEYKLPNDEVIVYEPTMGKSYPIKFSDWACTISSEIIKSKKVYGIVCGKKNEPQMIMNSVPCLISNSGLVFGLYQKNRLIRVTFKCSKEDL